MKHPGLLPALAALAVATVTATSPAEASSSHATSAVASSRSSHSPALSSTRSSYVPSRARSAASSTSASAVATETWSMTGVDRFFFANALLRSQGVVWDYDTDTLDFSWESGLQRTTKDYTNLVSRPMAIPPELFVQGTDHIGCLDYFEGHLVVPLEDGDAYLHPIVGLFEPDTLRFTGVYYRLPQSIQPDGVPWVAVDAPRRLLYSAQWNPTVAINAYDLDDNLAFVRQIPLDTQLGRIQGAKVYQGALYAIQDDDAKTLVKIDLESGSVTELLRMLDLPGVYPKDPFLETEGIAFYEGPSGSMMHLILIQSIFPKADGSGQIVVNPSSSLYHFAMTAP